MANCRVRRWASRNPRLQVPGGTTIRWWRTRLRGVAGLGIFALLLQLCLSFGHVHSPNLSSKIAAGTSAPYQGQWPSPAGTPDDTCPICTTLHIAASGVLPTPPAIDRPAEFARAADQVL